MREHFSERRAEVLVLVDLSASMFCPHFPLGERAPALSLALEIAGAVGAIAIARGGACRFAFFSSALGQAGRRFSSPNQIPTLCAELARISAPLPEPTDPARTLRQANQLANGESVVVISDFLHPDFSAAITKCGRRDIGWHFIAVGALVAKGAEWNRFFPATLTDSETGQEAHVEHPDAGRAAAERHLANLQQACRARGFSWTFFNAAESLDLVHLVALQKAGVLGRRSYGTV